MFLAGATGFSLVVTVLTIVIVTSVKLVYRLVSFSIMVPLVWFHGGEFLDFTCSQIFNAPNIYMIIYWILMLVMLLPIPFLFRPRKAGSETRIVLWRKFFHLIVLVLFVPSIVQTDGEFDELVALAGVLVLCLFVLMEFVRVSGKPSINLSLFLDRLIRPLLDHKDKTSSVVTSHMELLLAVVLPVWLAQGVGGEIGGRDYIISGLVTVGVGDSAAAIGGLYLTKSPHKIPWKRRSKKSLEGVLGFLIATNMALVSCGAWNTASCFASIVAGITEATMTRYDNAFLPIVYSFSRIVFEQISI